MKEYNTEDITERGRCPLLKLALKFNIAKAVDQHDTTTDHKPMDGYNLNIVAPDYLLTGLFRGLLTLCFLHINSDTSRTRLTILIRTYLLELGFQTQSVLFKKTKLVLGLSMSTLYCILCILPAVLNALDLLHTSPIKTMLCHLHRFCSLAFWWPCTYNDGCFAWEFVHGHNVSNYHRILQRLAGNFVKSVNTYCKSHPDTAHHIDRPNVHRLLELVNHTIPNYAHL